MSSSIQPEIGQTSSIGAVWPPEPVAHERLRGFYTRGVVQTETDCQQIADVYASTISQLNDHPDLTRMTIRFLVETPHLHMLEKLGVNIEAAIPICTDDEDVVLAYAGYNAAERTAGDDTLRMHGNLLRKIVLKDQPEDRDRTDRLESAGINAGIIDASTTSQQRHALQGQFLRMYGIFGYDETDVAEILHNDDNTIIYLEVDGEVVSTAMAERAQIPIAGFGDLELCEVTEASTLPYLRELGLYKIASGLLLEHLLNRQSTSPVHAIYGESNLAMPGVLIAGHKNGRRFSFFDRGRLGISNPNFGLLQQNFHIEDGREQRPYNDFAVSYLPLNGQEVV
jgi:hypothetical protein